MNLSTYRTTPFRAFHTTLCCVGFLFVGVGPTAADSIELPLRSVSLHAAGKGHFLFSGETTGGAFSVEVPTREIDDVLRAGLTHDPAGSVKVQMPAAADPRVPVASAIVTQTLGDVLLSMKGVSAMVTTQENVRVEGVIVAVELKPQAENDQIIQREILTVFTDDGLQSMPLSSVKSINPDDAQFRDRLQAALAQNAEPVKTLMTTIKFEFAAGEPRQVHVGIMRSMPMWKSTYRFENQQLIHRSVVENMSGLDWDGVALRLFDGNPVLFEMGLRGIAIAKLPERQRPMRHTVVPESFAQAKLSREQNPASGEPSDASGSGMMGMGMMGGGMGGMGGGMGGGGFFGGGMGGGGMGGGMAMAMSGASNDASGNTARNADLFGNPTFDGTTAPVDGTPAGSSMAFSFENVRLGTSMATMLDTVIDDVDVQPLSIYRYAYHPTTPLLSVSIKNETTALLPAGPISILFGDEFRSVLGEAIMPSIGPGAEQILGFAIDGGVRVEHEPAEPTDHPLSLEFNDELHQFTYKSSHDLTSVYVVANRSLESRTVVIEHPLPNEPFEWDGVQNDEVEVTQTSDGYQLKSEMGVEDQRTVTAIARHETTQILPAATLSIDLLRQWKAEKKWSEETLADVASVLDQRERLLTTNESLKSKLAARSEWLQEISRLSDQLTRERFTFLPQTLRSTYQQRLILLEKRKVELGKQVRTLAEQRQHLLQQLGIDINRPGDWSLSFGSTAELEASLMDASIEVEDKPEPPATDPFGGN